jgi:hypothetical protein
LTDLLLEKAATRPCNILLCEQKEALEALDIGRFVEMQAKQKERAKEVAPISSNVYT